MPSIIVEILLFAGAAELLGTRKTKLEIPDGANIEQMIGILIAKHPDLDKLARHSRWAVGNDFVGRDQSLEAGAQIAMIPPVSGG